MSRFILLVCVLVACNAAKPQTVTDPLQLAEVVLGKGLLQFPNTNQTHILFVQPASAYPNQPIKFLVIEKTTSKAVLEKSFRPGYVKWRDDQTIEYEDLPSIVKQNEINTLKTWTIPATSQAH
ncbi:MAG: hypothetical protein KF856_14665 [Cyclobacteriaceae bacterium]|nr:hypothetical protein [Cyclobacteriaceae bacterium]